MIVYFCVWKSRNRSLVLALLHQIPIFFYIYFHFICSENLCFIFFFFCAILLWSIARPKPFQTITFPQNFSYVFHAAVSFLCNKKKWWKTFSLQFFFCTIFIFLALTFQIKDDCGFWDGKKIMKNFCWSFFFYDFKEFLFALKVFLSTFFFIFWRIFNVKVWK